METFAKAQPSQAETLKQQLKSTWSAGNYAEIAKTLEPSARQFLHRHPPCPGARVLDVACGTGQIALPAARTAGYVAGVDIAENLIAQGRTRAADAGLDVGFEVGDAESLPYAEGNFDQVYSVIGAMFAPRPERVAAELTRVCKAGGEVIMANWTPEGFVGEFFKTVARHVPPPPQMPSPLLWGTETHVEARFAQHVASIRFERHLFEFRYPFGPSQVVDIYRRFFGPVVRAFASLDEHGRERLRDDLEALWDSHNQANDGTTYTQAEVLEIVAVPA